MHKQAGLTGTHFLPEFACAENSAMFKEAVLLLAGVFAGVGIPAMHKLPFASHITTMRDRIVHTPTLLKRSFYLLLFTLLGQASVANATLLSLQPDISTAQNGDSLAVELLVSGLGDFGPQSLSAFDIEIGFDPAVLSFTGYSLGGLLGDPGLFEAIDLSSGDLGASVNLSLVSLLAAVDLDALQPGAFSLATARFDVISLPVGAATSVSLLTGAILADTGGTALPFTSGAPAVIANRAAVPTPGTLWLLLGALVGWRTLRAAPASGS